MNLNSLISKDLIIFDDEIQSKDILFRKLSQQMYSVGRISDARRFVKDLYRREREVSTGLEDGFGIPHAKSQFVVLPTICFAHTSQIQDYLCLDDTHVDCVFMLAVPLENNNTHLEILSNLSRKLMRTQFRNDIRSSKSASEILTIINEQE